MKRGQVKLVLFAYMALEGVDLGRLGRGVSPQLYSFAVYIITRHGITQLMMKVE